VVVHQRKLHPCVVGITAMDSFPGGEGGQGVFRTIVLPAYQEVAGGDHAAVGAAALPPKDELMKRCEVTHQLQARIRNQEVRAMVIIAAARRAQVSGPGSDDNLFPVNSMNVKNIA
jgi:hypothetical protein